MIKGKEAIILTEGFDSCHHFKKGQKVTFIKVDLADFFVFVDETGMQQALEEKDFVFV
jgi:hypothetical protein